MVSSVSLVFSVSRLNEALCLKTTPPDSDRKLWRVVLVPLLKMGLDGVNGVSYKELSHVQCSNFLLKVE